jgi:hypothetical protein
LQDPKKLTQIGTFGFEINHLATLRKSKKRRTALNQFPGRFWVSTILHMYPQALNDKFTSKALAVWSSAGLPDFSWFKIPKLGKIYQITTKYTKCR